MLNIPGKLPLVIPSGFLLAILFWMNSCYDNTSKPGLTDNVPADSIHYVGREACRSCHEKQYDLFIGSDHDMAMDHADSSTVLGDFNDVTFEHHGITSRFFTKDNGFYVFTEGPDGEMEEYKVDFVFGFRPLQQYLIAFPGGRYQCLPLCWDSRPEKDGGQRWFHIYGDEKISHDDFLYWTRIMQNWNYMCAECHSTNLKKDFDAETDSYHTTWEEIDVSCEACHGPGSAHVVWAEEAAKHPVSQEPGNMGLALRFRDPEGGTWVFTPGSRIAVRSVKRDGRKTLETCARCHSRRSTIHEEYTFGKSFLDTHRPSLLEDNLYYPDGQILDEVYVFASFLQSKMYHEGVICSDCHDPHSLKVYVQGNALCYRCHLPDTYGNKSHHFHKENSTGALCVECHMPEKTYMQVDPRRDHSIRNPRPDLSMRLGTPNACTGCHNEKPDKHNMPGVRKLSDQEASDYFFKWYGAKERRIHYGETFWKARKHYPEALPELIRLAMDTTLPAMVRSSSYYYLSNYNEAAIYPAVASGLKDHDPLIRFGALEGSANLTGEQQSMLYRTLLYDSVRLIRTLAAHNFPQDAVNQLTGKEKSLYDKVLSEYMTTEMINADHPFTWMNLGNYNLEKGNTGEAEKDYRRAIRIEPYLPMSYINLADLYRRMQLDSKGQVVLEEGLRNTPGSADIHHALGLLLIRNARNIEGLEHLKQAAAINPENGRYVYVCAVGLYSSGKQQEAIIFLEKARELHPYDRDILFALVSYYWEMGQIEKARTVAEELTGYYPTDASYQEVLKRLKNLRLTNP